MGQPGGEKQAISSFQGVEFTFNFIFELTAQAHHKLAAGVDDFFLPALSATFQGQHERLHPACEGLPTQPFPESQREWYMRPIRDGSKNDRLLDLILAKQ